MQFGLSQRWLNHPCRYVRRKNLFRGYRKTLAPRCLHDAADAADASQEKQNRTRNIGIIAHIDAGKTTTTERMLYYSGYTRRIGDVDDGSTVTDFLAAERARGITIQSAAITFHWPPAVQESPTTKSTHERATGSLSPPLRSHIINLIDTPGHADFTFEVLRSLRILDGAVCIIDGVAGVEAQTEKVWYQAANYNIPKILYVNKLDRDGAAFGRTVKEIASKLHAWPAVCQIPWFEGGSGRFVGVVDIISLKALRWADGGDGKTITVMDLTELDTHEFKLVNESRKARTALIELLSEYDDLMVEKFLDCNEDHMLIMPSDILASLRLCVLTKKATVVPVFAGASFRNIGVQPLLDAVLNLLPSPTDSPDPEISAGNVKGGLQDLVSGRLALLEATKSTTARRTGPSRKSSTALLQNLETCALAFKVVNDAKRGVLVYVRVYYGILQRNAMLFNTNLQVSERAPRLLEMYASDAAEVGSISAGQIGVIAGLKYARTGDTLLSYTGTNSRTGPPAPLNSLQLRPIDVPPPVFFASIEPHSLSEEQPVANALALLLREDPSLQLSVDEDSGQTLLSGMGELHLEIARDRLIQDLKAKASMGKIEIGYRECIVASSEPETALFDRETAGRKGKAGCTAAVKPKAENDGDIKTTKHNTILEQDGNVIDITVSTQTEDNNKQTSASASPFPSHLSPAIITTALRTGVLAALARGPQYAFALHSTHVSINIDITTQVFGADTTSSALSSAARLATQAALRKSSQQNATSLMEPVMAVVISVDGPSLGTVVHDLTSARGAHILSLDDADVISVSGGGQTRDDLPVIDMKRVYAPPDPFEAATVAGGEDFIATRGGQRTITARVPLKEMVGYLKHLRSLTGGRGTFVMSVDGFERMGAVREKAVLREMRGL